MGVVRCLAETVGRVKEGEEKIEEVREMVAGFYEVVVGLVGERSRGSSGSGNNNTNRSGNTNSGSFNEVNKRWTSYCKTKSTC